MLTPGEVWEKEVETDCTPEGDTKMLLCWAGVLPEITLNSQFAAQTRLEGFGLKLFLHCLFFTNLKFLFPELDYKVVYTYCEFLTEGEVRLLFAVVYLPLSSKQKKF